MFGSFGNRPHAEATINSDSTSKPGRDGDRLLETMASGYWISPPSWQAPSWEQFNWAANCTLFSQYIAHISLDTIDLYGNDLSSSGRLVRPEHSIVEAYILSSLPANSTSVPSGSEILDWHYYYRMIATFNVTDSPDIPRIPVGFQSAATNTAPFPEGIPAYIAYTLSQASPICIQEGCETLHQDSFLNKDVAGIGVSYFS